MCGCVCCHQIISNRFLFNQRKKGTGCRIRQVVSSAYQRFKIQDRDAHQVMSWCVLSDDVKPRKRLLITKTPLGSQQRDNVSSRNTRERERWRLLDPSALESQRETCGLRRSYFPKATTLLLVFSKDPITGCVRKSSTRHARERAVLRACDHVRV